MTKIAYDRQLETARNLEIPPRDYDEMREYTVDFWENKYRPGKGTLCVTRTYGRNGLTISWRECITIGPRGGTKTLFHDLIY